MSQRLISRSADLKKLRDEGYDLEIRSGCLLVKDVPYVNSRKEVKRGILVMKLVLAGDETARPDDHIAYFAAITPAARTGPKSRKIKHGSGAQSLADGVMVQHSFSAKPKPDECLPGLLRKSLDIRRHHVRSRLENRRKSRPKPSRSSSRRTMAKSRSNTSTPLQAGLKSSPSPIKCSPRRLRSSG